MQSPVLIARDLKKTYRVGELEINALRGIDLEFYRGEFVVLLGPSGSGKSTLLNILGGLDTPTSGILLYEDHDLLSSTSQQLTEFRKDHVGFVFQFFNLIPNLTAFENVQLAADLVKDSMEPGALLKLVGLSERSAHFPSQLSGGEQQRVAIARAIAKRPSILLCDEPTGALDVKTGKLVLEAIAKVHRELNTLVVVITHNAAIADLADRVIRISDGLVSEVQVNKSKISIDEVWW